MVQMARMLKKKQPHFRAAAGYLNEFRKGIPQLL